MLGQLRLSCTKEKQFRALNLDISCPAHLPLPTACRCVTRSKTGGVVTKINGTISTYDVSVFASSPSIRTPHVGIQKKTAKILIQWKWKPTVKLTKIFKI